MERPGKGSTFRQTASHGRLTLIDSLDGDFLMEMRRSVREGMALSQKSIPCKYLYDDVGSDLFNQICLLPEYYPTRTELAILDRHAGRIMEFFRKDGGSLVDIGSGSDLKIRKLLHAAPRATMGSIRYIPVDISSSGLMQSSCCLLKDFDCLEILGVIGDFTSSLGCLPQGRKLICFFGSTIGNFDDCRAAELLAGFAGVMNPGDALLVGLDLLKPVEIIEAAYNDSAGLTARFNLNILRHVNQKLHADFILRDFGHRAFFNHELSRIEMHLEARRPVEADIGDIGLKVRMAVGETIHTEISRKFSRHEAEELFSRAGFIATGWYTDEREWFSLAELRLM